MLSIRLLTLTFWLFFAGCSDVDPVRPPVPVTPPTGLPDLEKPKPGKDGKVDPLEQAKADMVKYKELAAQAAARYETLQKQATDDAIRSQTLWITGICLLLAAVAGVGAFLIPIGKRILVSAAIGLGVVAVCAQAFQWAIPYLPWVGGAIIIGGGLWAVVHWRKLSDAVKVAADHGDRIEEWLQDLPEEMKEKVNTIIADAKKETKQQAERLRVQAPLQTLRGKVPSLLNRLRINP